MTKAGLSFFVIRSLGRYGAENVILKRLFIETSILLVLVLLEACLYGLLEKEDTKTVCAPASCFNVFRFVISSPLIFIAVTGALARKSSVSPYRYYLRIASSIRLVMYWLSFLAAHFFFLIVMKEGTRKNVKVEVNPGILDELFCNRDGICLIFQPSAELKEIGKAF